MPAPRLLACCLAASASSAVALRVPHARAGGPDSPAYYWPHARGNVGRYSIADYTAPSNLTASLSWSWHHPNGRYHTIVVGSPLLDDKKNIYVACEDGLRKFSQDGQPLWHYNTRGAMAYSSSLANGAVFGATLAGWIFAVDMETGKEQWALRKAQQNPGDTGYTEAHAGVVVAGVNSSVWGGAQTVLGLDARDGRTLWEYQSSVLLWNFMPVFPDSESFIFMDIRGSVYRHALHNATLLWKTPTPEVSARSFSDGGVMVGPDGTAYTCSNYEGKGQQGKHGALRAYRLEDGKLLWDRFLEYPCNSWPVISADMGSVIVPTGAFVSTAASDNGDIRAAFGGKSVAEMHDISLALGGNERRTYRMPEVTAAVRAFDARSGEPQWSTELPTYGRLAAKGDEEGFLERKALSHREQCFPAQFSSPTLSADGTVYVGRADGLLYAVEAGTGRFRTFDAGAGFLHPGTSWAPGMMAVTTCDGLYVWNY